MKSCRSPTRLARMLLVLASAASVAAAAATKAPPGCSFLGQHFAVGERWTTGPPGKCAKYLCEGEGDISAVTCPWFVAAPGCEIIPGDEGADYPGCCPLRKCHHDQAEAAEATPPTVVLRTAADATTVIADGADGADSTTDVFTPTMATAAIL